MPNFVRAQVRAYGIAEYGARLAAEIAHVQHTDATVYWDSIREDIASLRTALAVIEDALELTEQQEAA